MQTTEELIPSDVIATSHRRPWTVFSSGPFRRLWVATTLSLFGDFFSYVAMAWLVLQLTGSRAVLMMVGGALADRLSPRLTLLGSMGLRALVVAPLAVLVLTGRVQLWEVYGIAIVFGVVDAFFMPARQSILPATVADHELEPGNAIINVSSQASVIVGPVVGGLVVAGFGTGWAFAADAACFAIGFLAILALPQGSRGPAGARHPEGGLAGQIAAGLRYAWSDVGIRVLLIVIAVIDFSVNGAIGVGLLAWFVPGMQSAPIQLLYSVGIVVLFTGFLFYDFSNIRLHYRLDDYVIASIRLYLDFVNLFWAVLRIAIAFGIPLGFWLSGAARASRWRATRLEPLPVLRYE